jgi:hypothetical protein
LRARPASSTERCTRKTNRARLGGRVLDDPDCEEGKLVVAKPRLDAPNCGLSMFSDRIAVLDACHPVGRRGRSEEFVDSHGSLVLGVSETSTSASTNSMLPRTSTVCPSPQILPAVRQFGLAEFELGRLRQGVAHVAGEAVDEVVLAPVGLVGDDDDVALVRKRQVSASPQAAYQQGDQPVEDQGNDAACQREPESPAQSLYQVVLKTREGAAVVDAGRSPSKRDPATCAIAITG